MKAGILTTPNRQQYLPKLMENISPHVEEIRLFNDIKHKGQRWNMMRMFRAMLETAKKDEMILLMTDDAETYSGWKEDFDKIHSKANGSIYVMFNRYRYMFKPENIKRGYIKKVLKQEFYDVGTIYINQQDLPEKVEQFYQKNRGVMKYERHGDMLVQDCLKELERECVVTTPSLFEHAGAETSVIGHNIGKAYMYIQNVDNDELYI